MSDFRKEFPDFDPETLPEIPEGWVDVSWHNDACPAFHNRTLRLSVFIDYEKPEDREWPESGRFHIFQTDEEGCHINAEAGDYVSNSWAGILRYIEQHRALLNVLSALESICQVTGGGVPGCVMRQTARRHRRLPPRIHGSRGYAMTSALERLSAKYETWLADPENANVPKISADEALAELQAQGVRSLDNGSPTFVRADHAASALIGRCDDAGFPCPTTRPEPMRRQIEWLITFCADWIVAQTAVDICDKWVAKIGGGFHPDTSGADYVWIGGPHKGSACLSPQEVREYGQDMTVLFRLALDPYEVACDSLEAWFARHDDAEAPPAVSRLPEADQ